jgi:hypothetical protein
MSAIGGCCVGAGLDRTAVGYRQRGSPSGHPDGTWILPGLTALAAAGLMIVMTSATVLHIARGEINSAILAAVLLVLITMVAYMRWKVRPIAARKRA